MDMRRIYRNTKKILTNWVESPSRAYLVVASVAVVAFAFITPPFQGPDEQAHYIRVQYLSHGNITPFGSSDDNDGLPKSIQTVLKKTFFTDDLRGDTNQKYELFRTKDALGVPLNESERYHPPMVGYSPVPYLPAVPAVVVSNALNLSPLVSMYLARLSLGFASILLFFYAIQLVPNKKYAVAVVGLIPMMLFQQSMITADSVSYALLALFLALLLYLKTKRKITNRQWVILGVVCVALALAKPLIYLFLPLIILLLKDRRSFAWTTGIAIACAVSLASWMLVSNVKSEEITIYGMPDNVDATKQINVIESNPKRGARVLWNSYMTSYGDDEFRGVVGVFGAGDTLYPFWMISLYVSLIAIVLVFNLDNDRKQRYPKPWRTFALVLSVAYFLLVNLALYLGYTPVDFSIVYGVQGRYFLPLVIVIVFAVVGSGLRIHKAEVIKTRARVVFAASTLVALAIFITIQRYYLYTP